MTASITTPSTPTTRSRPWWLELILVDLRHALWPWLAYLMACLIFTQVPDLDKHYWGPSDWLWVNGIVLFAVPAIVSGMFTADFSYATVQALLSFPRDRSRVWLTRFTLLLGLIAVPFLLAYIYARISAPEDLIIRVYGAFMMQMLYCYVTFGPLLAVLLRKGLVAWSAIVVSPLLLALAAVILQNALGYKESATFAQHFPYVPPFFFWFYIILGIPAAIFAWYKWQRLELRQ